LHGEDGGREGLAGGGQKPWSVSSGEAWLSFRFFLKQLLCFALILTKTGPQGAHGLNCGRHWRAQAYARG